MELFVTKVSGWKPLACVTKISLSDFAILIGILLKIYDKQHKKKVSDQIILSINFYI